MPEESLPIHNEIKVVGELEMLVKLSHAIVITMLLYFVAGVSNANNVQTANVQITNFQTADAPSEPELIAESELKEISNKFVRAISLRR